MSAGVKIRSFVLACLGLLLAALAGMTQTPALKIVYPINNHTTTSSQIFLIGSAPSNGQVWINGQPIRRNKSGNFSPSFPLTVGVNAFVIEYKDPKNVDSTKNTIAVTRELNQPKIPTTLEFGPDSLYPQTSVARLPGETLCFEAIAPLGSTVIARLGQSEIPLVAAQTNAIALNSSVLTGRTDTQTFEGRQLGCGIVSTSGTPSYEMVWQGQRLKQSPKGSIEILNPQKLITVEVTAPFGTSRTGSSTDFARLTPVPQGTRAQVTGEDGLWWRLDYGAGNQVWIKKAETREIGRSSVPVRSILRGVNSKVLADWTEIRFPLEQRVPFSLNQGDRTLTLTLHHTVSQSDILKLVRNPTLDRITWQQLNPETLAYTLQFKSLYQWGYKTRYDGTTLILSVKNPPNPNDRRPSQNQPLSGLKILLDPGHGGPEDFGSVGNGGIPEKEVTLKMAKLLRSKLLQQGATVIFTREADVDLGPNERAELITKAEPTLAISLHYNALPDDGNAEKTQGVAAFWYQAQAQPFAQFMHDVITQKLGRSSDGIYWNNLALTRPAIAPSIMLELGYMIHPDEYDWITNPQEQEKLAATLSDGITAWLTARPTIN